MARTKTISDEQILEAAREVFLERGPMATTAEIACRAKVSEGSIYRRYPNKVDLFETAMGIPKEAPWVASLQGYLGQGDLRGNLIELCVAMLDFAREIIPKLVMVMASRLDFAARFSRRAESTPVRAMQALAGFFEQERRLGRIRDCDPVILARLFISAVQHYAFAEYGGINEHFPPPPQSYIEGLVDTIWQGISPNSTELTPESTAGVKRSDSPRYSSSAGSASSGQEDGGIDD